MSSAACDAWYFTRSRSPGNCNRRTRRTRSGPSSARQTVPTGLSAVPPPGPAIPVTPTPTVTPSPRHLSLYDAVWKGKYTLHDFATQKETTKIITLEMMQPEMIGEGKDRRRDEGAMFVEGVTNWMALAFTKVDPETGSVSFRVRPIKTDFKGTLIGDEITGTVQEGVVNKGTFELRANREELPQRRPKAEHGGGL